MSASDTEAPPNGLETFLTRVEDWECDHNGHWNTRFYGQAFAEASDVVAALGDRGVPPVGGPLSWHVRFHRELFSGDVANVHSSRVPDGDFSGALLHVLSGGGEVSATALHSSDFDAAGLPPADADVLIRALPRGLRGVEVDWEALTAAPQRSAPMGLVRSSDLDGAGRLHLPDLLRLCGRGSQDHRDTIGFGSAYTQETNIGRMLVELHTTLFPDCRPAKPLRMDSRLISVQQKSYVSAHQLRHEDGRVAARIELCLLAVDMVARRSTEMPAFLRDLV